MTATVASSQNIANIVTNSMLKLAYRLAIYFLKSNLLIGKEHEGKKCYTEKGKSKKKTDDTFMKPFCRNIS